jgi:hypothetical protein
MIEWMLLEGTPETVAEKAVPRGLTGGSAVMATLTFGKHSKPITIVSVEGSRAKRPGRWPEILTDWAEIYSTKLFPSDAIPVLCEEASGLGADALAIFGEPGLGRATIGWYAKGLLAVYERVSAEGTIAWAPGQPLGRPFDGNLRRAASWVGHKLASSASDESLFDRMDNTNRAVGEALISRALWRLLDTKPPALDDLAGLVANAQLRRIAP